jgi:hypothetical protein
MMAEIHLAFESNDRERRPTTADFTVAARRGTTSIGVDPRVGGVVARLGRIVSEDYAAV